MLYTISDYTKLRDRALTIKNTKEVSYKNLVNAQHVLSSKVKELAAIKEDRLIQESSIKILKKVIDESSQEFINSLVDLLSFAVKTIIYDEDYSVEIEISETKIGNNAEFILVDNATGNKTPMDACGGGIRAIIGFTLQVFCIMTYKLSRIIIMDEALSAVSDRYVPTLMQFIKQLSTERGFIFIAVCHDLRFLTYADTTLEMVKGKLSVVAKEGEYVE